MKKHARRCVCVHITNIKIFTYNKYLTKSILFNFSFILQEKSVQWTFYDGTREKVGEFNVFESVSLGSVTSLVSYASMIVVYVYNVIM